MEGGEVRLPSSLLLSVVQCLWRFWEGEAGDLLGLCPLVQHCVTVEGGEVSLPLSLLLSTVQCL